MRWAPSATRRMFDSGRAATRFYAYSEATPGNAAWRGRFTVGHRSLIGIEDLPVRFRFPAGAAFEGLIEAREDTCMKAIRIHRRGGPEQLIYEEVPNPSPKTGEALVQVMAAGVTPTELSWSSASATRDD